MKSIVKYSQKELLDKIEENKQQRIDELYRKK